MIGMSVITSHEHLSFTRVVILLAGDIVLAAVVVRSWGGS